jgi:hypothetical protein
LSWPTKVFKIYLKIYVEKDAAAMMTPRRRNLHSAGGFAGGQLALGVDLLAVDLTVAYDIYNAISGQAKLRHKLASKRRR